MKTKKFFLPALFLVITLIAYIIASVTFCYTTKPEVATGEFPFSITYEYKGEVKTFSGVYKAMYTGSETIHGEHSRYWSGETVYDNPVDPEIPQIIEQNDELMTTLAIQENMHAGYFMGDYLHKDYYLTYGMEGPMPYIEYYDYTNEIYLDEENKDEVLESIGFKVIDYSYPEPIENSFSFSGVEYEADNVTIFVLISLVFLILCLIFVRKDKEYKYSNLDKAGIVFNFLVGFLAVPFITFFCMMFGIVESNVELINQITYNIPSVTVLCLALSVVFRRKGFSKTGFFVQFGGIVLFTLSFLLDSIV